MRYYNEFAEIYDDVSVGTKGDVEFYKRQAKKTRGKVLEVACGTGRILFPLLNNGVDIEGMDISVKMLDVLIKKATKEGLKPNVWQADMRTFKIKTRYDLIIVPYRAFNHVESSADQIKTLTNFRRHLKSGGKLVINFFYPDYHFMARMNGKKIKKESITIRGEKYALQEQVNYEPIEQLIRAVWFLTDQKGRTRKVLKIHLCYIYKKEFELLLRSAGFKKWKVFGGFNGEKLKLSKQEMVWIIQK